MSPLRFRGAFSPLIMLAIAAASNAAVTVSQDTVSFKTWNEGLPDTNPWIELFPSYNYAMYPYTLRNNLLTATASVSWRRATVENEYLKCSLFPD